jgi:hypothetical protein
MTALQPENLVFFKKNIYINTREREARQQQGFPAKCRVTGCAWRLITLFKYVTDAMLVPLPLFKYAVVEETNLIY